MPKFYDLFTNVLKATNTSEPRRLRDVLTDVADGLELSAEERAETMSGGGNRAQNRAYWASLHLVKAGAIERPTKGYVQATAFGRELLAKHPEGVTLKILTDTEGVQEWYAKSKASQKEKHAGEEEKVFEAVSEAGQTPDELIAGAYHELRSEKAAELLDLLRSESSKFLEHAVLRLLEAMGYGGGEGSTQVLGGAGDGGVDGVINEDKLGLEQIYVQAKRYAKDNVVGPGAIRDFNTAVQTNQASRGVFITTSHFSKDAREVLAKLLHTRIILIDGNELANLMLDYGVGVTVERSYDVYKIDENFFDS